MKKIESFLKVISVWSVLETAHRAVSTSYCGTIRKSISRNAIGFLICCIFFFPAALSRSLAANPDQKPNFIFILIDDMGWTDLGCYGSKFYQTPNIDKLAGQGMKFTQAYAACPVCSPTRAAILTGKYPARLHLTDWLPGRADRPDQKLLRPDFLQQLPLSEITIAEALKSAGYSSANVGKWHLGGKGFGPEEQGFDLNIGGNGAGSPASYFSPYQGSKRSVPLSKGRKDEYLTDRLADEALKFIEENRSKPFFLYLPFYAVHIPLQGKPELVEKYAKLSDPNAPHNHPVYAAMIQSVDEGVGRLMEKLDELMLAENTVVIFTTDNGGVIREGKSARVTSNEPLREGKGYLYEGGIRVPLIVRWPGNVKAGSVCDAPVVSVDYFPTIMEAAGVKLSTNQIVDGESIMSLLSEKGKLKRSAIYWHYPHYANQGGAPGGVIRDGDFKLIQWYETGRFELYNLREDVSEKENLVDKNSKKARELANKLDLWRRNLGAQMMLPNPDYDPKAIVGTE